MGPLQLELEVDDYITPKLRKPRAMDVCAQFTFSFYYSVGSKAKERVYPLQLT